MKKMSLSRGALVFAFALCLLVLSGCEKKQEGQQAGNEHEPLTIMTTNVKYEDFKILLEEKYPEVRLKFISYTGGNGTGYSQYLLDHSQVPDIFSISIFGTPEKQKEALLDLSGYEFLSNYKTADINQVTLGGSVYLVPTNSNFFGLYYNKTMFAEHGWKVPGSFEELTALTRTIQATGIDPAAAQFELAGNGFFDLFTLAKTDFLSTPDGLQWEQDFKAGKATASQGLSSAASLLQALIDCGFLDAEDTERTYNDCLGHFLSRGAAMYLNAGSLPRFTQNEDGSGDEYGVMPFFGVNEDDSVLISKALCYYGLSKSLAEPGNEQKLSDALKVMALISTQEGQKSLNSRSSSYVAPLKNAQISEDSPFYEVENTIRSGHTSALAYAGYEPIMIGVGEKVRDWAAGKCAGDDVLKLIDQLQSDSLSESIPPVGVADEDFTLEETAQLQAEAFRQAAKADIGLVSLGGYHNGVENPSGVCGALLKGDITQMVVNALPPSVYGEAVSILTLSGAEIKELLETGFAFDPKVDFFPYIPAGITVVKTDDHKVKSITWADGSPFDETKEYTVAIDEDGYTAEIGEKGAVKKTELATVDALTEYFKANSPLSPLESSIW